MRDDESIERAPRKQLPLSTRDMIIYTLLSVLGLIAGIVIGSAAGAPRDEAAGAAIGGVLGAIAWPLAVKHILFKA